MTAQEQRQREALEIILAASVGEATEVQCARLSQLVVEDESLALYAVQLLSQEAWLSWHGSQVQTERLLAELGINTYETMGRPRGDGSPSEVANLPGSAGSGGQVKRGSHGAALLSLAPASVPWLPGTLSWFAVGLAAAVLVCVGAVVGGLATKGSLDNGRERVAAGDADASSGEMNRHISPYVARFVQGTACVWEPNSVPPAVGSGSLPSGQSFNLMEGLAEIKLNFVTAGTASLQMEGPAKMVLTAEGTASLSLGKFCARVYPRRGDVAFDTPLGQIRVLGDSSLGVVVRGLEAEVHVFMGEVDVSPWASSGSSIERFHVKSGQSLRLCVNDSESMKITRDVAEPGLFATQRTMTSDRLEITEEYVNAVKSAAPLIYWRFEESKDGIVPNEMAERFPGVIRGAPEWSVQGKNRAVEFGTALTGEAAHAYIESDESLGNNISDSYSIEFWVKPSHYHLGALVSFVSMEGDFGQHGALVELGGPLPTQSDIEHPGRVRFLHRDPPSGDVATGTSCFSTVPYDLRRWSHVVAVKDGSEMRLYVDGQRVGTAENNTKLSANLSVLIAQLDRNRHGWGFVGQIDELAVYNRALSDREIQTHYEIVRPKKESSPGAI